MATDISKLGKNLGELGVFRLSQIFTTLYASKDYKWAEIIGNQLKKAEYDNYSLLSLENTISNLTSAVLMGCDYSILKPFLDRKAVDKNIRTCLGWLKATLEYNFPLVPAIYQENARRLLNDLADIPIPKEIEENEE